MENGIMIYNEEDLRSKIYMVRGLQVMLDSDLAEIYGYSVKAFNQQVKNNIEKFDDDFMFQLTLEEAKELLRSKKMTLNETENKRGSNIKYAPYVFTEQGVYMLMTVLKGELATKQSKTLVRLFKQMKDYVVENQQIVSQRDFLRLSLQTAENAENIAEFRKRDLAYQKIYTLANKSIFIVDNYISLKTLVLFKNAKQNVSVTIFSDNTNSGLHKVEFVDFCKEFPGLKIDLKQAGGIFHDRYIILDYNTKAEKIYHCGASSKDGGRKVTTITLTEDTSVYKALIGQLLNNQPLVLK